MADTLNKMSAGAKTIASVLVIVGILIGWVAWGVVVAGKANAADTLATKTDYRVDQVEKDNISIKKDVESIKEKVGDLKTEVGDIKDEVGEVKAEMGQIRSSQDRIEILLEYQVDQLKRMEKNHNNQNSGN